MKGGGLSFILYLGFRNIFGMKGRISANLAGGILGIGLSLIPLVVVLEVADGMIEGITRRYLEVGTYHLQVGLAGDADRESYQALAETLRAQSEVTGVIAERQGIGLLYTQRGRSAVTVRAVPPEIYETDPGFRSYLTVAPGEFSLQEPDAVLLGREVAQRLQAGVGDQVKLLSVVSLSGQRSLPRVSSFEVKGIFSTGYQELDKLWIYIPLETGWRVLPRDGSSQFIGVKVRDPFTALEQQLRRLESALPAEAQVYSWYQLERANYKSFQTTKALLLFIMGLIVVVAAVNISSTLIMVVLEKTQEIGILKAIGAGPPQIVLSFLFSGLLIGLSGVAVGLSLGLAVAVNINEVLKGLEWAVNLVVQVLRTLVAPLGSSAAAGTEAVRVFNAEFYLEEIPIRIRGAGLCIVAALTLLLSTLAALLPARSAGKIKPLDVLRKI